MLRKDGFRRGKPGKVRIFECTDCGRRFTANFGFEKRQFDGRTIAGALQVCYAGMGVRDVASHYEMIGIDVNHSTMYRWAGQYSKMTAKYLNGTVPRAGNWFGADGVRVKTAWKQCYLFAPMDDDARYWLASDLTDSKFQHNADSLLDMTKRQARIRETSSQAVSRLARNQARKHLARTRVMPGTSIWQEREAGTITTKWKG